MFNNIIYLIVVLLVFNIGPPESRVEESAGYALFAHLLGWVVFAVFCRLGFRRLAVKAIQGEVRGGLAGRYQRLIMRLSIMAVFLFALDVHLFDLRYWLQFVPGAGTLSVIPGLLGLGIFFLYLTTVWYFAHPVYALAYGPVGDRRGFIVGNLRLNVPILFPWMGLTFLYDLMALTPWGGPDGLLGSTEGQLLFFAVFLGILMVFLPRLVQTWWACTPFPRTEKVLEIERFFREQGFRYRGLLRWSLFEGRMLTAGIMGIVPRYRYILVTDGLMSLLPIDELKAVMAHEMAHARYKHLLFYILFFLGFAVLFFGLFDVFFYFLASQPFFTEALKGGSPEGGKLFHLSMAVPVLVTMLVYFRFVMGFFMRNFERQADLFAAVTVGHPGPVARSLERIAEAGGKTRDLPSWHHFSIRERVECLERAGADPGVVKRHNRFVSGCLVFYLTAVIGLGWFLNFSDMKQDMPYTLMERALVRQIQDTPDDPLLYRDLAMIHHHLEEYGKAVSAYEKSLALGPETPAALNNMAWILLTAPDKSVRDERRALRLAERAVALQRAAPFLDTLAEAHYANGDPGRALRLIDEALALVEDGKDYYEGQRKKFLEAVQERPEY
ncbi:MAG: M48 family metalloprotease [Thermodesulfobacteriota bacterium]